MRKLDDGDEATSSIDRRQTYVVLPLTAHAGRDAAVRKDAPSRARQIIIRRKLLLTVVYRAAPREITSPVVAAAGHKITLFTAPSFNRICLLAQPQNYVVCVGMTPPAAPAVDTVRN